MKWTQLYGATQAAQGRTLQDAAAYGGGPDTSDLPGPSLRNSMRLMSGFSPGTGWGETSLTRTRSAIRGPITDRRGLGTLAPYVLPGLLRRASMGILTQLSQLQMFPSQRFPDDIMDQSEEARPFTSPVVQQQQPQLWSGRQPAHRHDLPTIAQLKSVLVCPRHVKCRQLQAATWCSFQHSPFCTISL